MNLSSSSRTLVRRAKTKENLFAKYVGALPAFPGGIKEINAWVRNMRDDDGDEEE